MDWRREGGLGQARTHWRTHWVQLAAQIVVSAVRRLLGRDVMLYVGGVSFFALLAGFPALAILLGVYGILTNPQTAEIQASAFAQLLPPGAHALVEDEVQRLVHVPTGQASTQSVVALLVGLYATHRGFKALIAGLSFIHDDEKPRGIVGFNVLAFVALLAAFAFLGALSGVFLTVRLLATTLHLEPMKGAAWWASEWTWASLGMTLGLTLIYRFAMASRPVAWRASLVGGATAAALSMTASWIGALYVRQFTHFGATYGSVAAVVVLLIWLSWNVNAVFFGAAVATEVELVSSGPGVIRPRPSTPRRRRPS